MIFRRSAWCVRAMVMVATLAPAAAGTAQAAGAPWTIQATPSTRGNTAELAAVSCWSATACIAAGTQGTAAVPQPLAERWQASGWTIQPVPQPAGSASAVLAGLSCPSATACAAVGYYQASSGAQKVLAARWNGTTWTIQPAPGPAGGSPALDAVSCPAPATCLAVGDYSTDSGIQKTLAERWNGTTWSRQAIPSPPGSIATLTGVSCPTTASCTAAGDYVTGAGTQKVLAEHWNGTSWTIQPTPHPAGTSPTLAGVSCSMAASCTAAGDYLTPTGKQKTLAEHWDGTSWAIQPTPNPDGNVPALDAVSCPSATACTATGSYQASAHTGKTLDERYQP